MRGKGTEVSEKAVPTSEKSFAQLVGFFRYLLPYKKFLLCGLFFLMLSSCILMIFPYLTGKLVDIAMGKKDEVFRSIELTIGYMGIAIAAQCVSSYFRVYFFSWLTEKAVTDIRVNLYGRFLRMPLSFFEKHPTGDLFSRLTSDVAILQNSFSVTLVELIRQTITLGIALVLIFSTTPYLSWILLGSSPVFILIAMGFGRFIRRLTKKTQDAHGRSHGVAQECLQNALVVKGFSSEPWERRRYKHLQEEALKIALGTAKYRAGFIALVMFSLLGALTGVMWYGTLLVESQEMSSGDLLSFVLYTAFIAGSMAGLGDVYAQLQRARGAAQRIWDIMNEENEEDAMGGNIIKPFPTGDIIYEDISFHYPLRTDLNALQHVNLKIPEGKRIAILGKNGSGKTTLLKLLLRFYKPQIGKITIASVPIYKISPAWLRKHIGWVPQNPLLFEGSISENIRYGFPEASEKQIQDAAEQAHVMEFVEKFPQKMKTHIGERGEQLSGGQRQRIALARVILKNPNIVILDEATSSIDPISEELIQKSLDLFTQHRTTIVISHKPNTLFNLDHIFLMENGKVKDQGTPSTLIPKYFPSHQDKKNKERGSSAILSQ
ncbi:MAG: ABC transporter ATP-binding protein [Cytophagales bacterium]|nr:ABC transporter ATP-binding protein [Cytophagales bacterium]